MNDEAYYIRCMFCDEPIAERQLKFRAIEGFEKLRTEGGANQITLKAVRHDDRGNEMYACESCVRLRSRGLELQEALAV